MDLAHADVRRLLDYEPETGVFTWRERPGSSHHTKIWNARFAGSRAGSVGDEGYRHIKLSGRRRREHRLAWLWMVGKFPSDQIDHRDGDRGNNRWSNLAAATATQNQWNRGVQSNNRLGVKGVWWDADVESIRLALATVDATSIVVIF